MLLQASQGQSGSAHVIVVGNEKGGTGKSTLALHLAVALMKAGQRVATIDLDCRQKTFTHYINNRRGWARRGRPSSQGADALLHLVRRDPQDRRERDIEFTRFCRRPFRAVERAYRLSS